MNPPAQSNFQNRFPRRAKWSPSSPESIPGLIPQKRHRRSGATRSARAWHGARTYRARRSTVRRAPMGGPAPLIPQ